MTEIKNYQFYTNEMKKGLADKLFFIDKGAVFSNLDLIFDYGCADGALLNEISEIAPDKTLVGFDLDSLMIERAKERNINNSHFFNEFEKAAFYATLGSRKSWAILCSSIIHEVYSYGTPESIQDFWFNLNNGDHDYIIIRDMGISEKDLFFKGLDGKMLKAVFEKADPEQLKDYINVWGDFYNNKDLIHFLYKYRYLDNWQREVRENYFPVTLEDYDRKINFNKFEIIHKEHYLLPFQKEIIKKDFDVDFEANTHIKMILKRKNKNI